MIVFKLKLQMAVLVFLFLVSANAAILPPAMAQSPTADSADRDAAAAKRRSDGDKEQLQGQWQLLSIAIEGKTILREEKLEAWKETFANDLMIEGDRVRQKGATQGKVTLNDTLEPKQITIQDVDGKLTYQGIYAIDDGTLKVCMNGNGTDGHRPETFATTKGSAVVLLTLKKLDPTSAPGTPGR